MFIKQGMIVKLFEVRINAVNPLSQRTLRVNI